MIVGEFNAGKSACINALHYDEIFEEGVIPAIHQITMLRYGEPQQRRLRDGTILELSYPTDFLRDITILDTPVSMLRIDSPKILLWQKRCLMRESYQPR